MLWSDESFASAGKLLDGFGVETDVGLEANQEDGCAGAVAVDFGYPLWWKVLGKGGAGTGRNNLTRPRCFPFESVAPMFTLKQTRATCAP